MVLLKRNVDFPYTHDLKDLVEEVSKLRVAVPSDVALAEGLTRYAVNTRYPHSEEITEENVDNAMRIAEATVSWASGLVTAPEQQA